MEYPCFLIEEVNERVVHKPCTDPDCDCGGYDDRIFDVQRSDTGEIIEHDVTHIWHNPKDDTGIPVGAMWWETFTTSDRAYPKGPQDYDGYAEHELDNLREAAVKHPDWYRGTDPTTGLPDRQHSFVFEDGPVLSVMTPGGVWRIDSRASNCTMPYDYEHRCWVRHGTPPLVTVDKDGNTCAAGAGSIQCGDYHGFLRDGKLVP